MVNSNGLANRLLQKQAMFGLESLAPYAATVLAGAGMAEASIAPMFRNYQMKPMEAMIHATEEASRAAKQSHQAASLGTKAHGRFGQLVPPKPKEVISKPMPPRIKKKLKKLTPTPTQSLAEQAGAANTHHAGVLALGGIGAAGLGAGLHSFIKRARPIQVVKESMSPYSKATFLAGGAGLGALGLYGVQNHQNPRDKQT